MSARATRARGEQYALDQALLPRDPLAWEHHAAALDALVSSGPALDRAAAWGRQLARLLPAGGRLLVAGNGGSAAQAQHLSAEFVGRFRDERAAYSATALTADSAALTAIVNDFGHLEAFARQVDAHGRAGDVLLLLSTSGRSPNLLAAAERGGRRGLRTWALTGPLPNPLAGVVEQAAAVHGDTTAAIQEVHQVALHILCAAFDRVLSTPVRGGRS